MNFDVVTIARLAARAELAWRDGAGRLHATALVPLVIDGTVTAALPFDQSGTALHLADADRAVLAFSDSRMALKGWSPCAVPVDVDVTADRTGEWTWTGALDQEVRKHPPARLLIDTAVQRREHWWYVPRWIVRLVPSGRADALARRHGADDGLLVVDDRTALLARTVAVDGWDAGRVVVTPLAAAPAGSDPVGGNALLFGHDFSVPDQERSSQLVVSGRLDGHVLTVAARHGDLRLPAPRLLRRLRDHFRLERACRRALATYDASPAAAM